MIAAVVGTCATFIILFGAGMRNWTVVAIGVALFVLAVGIVAVTTLRGGSRSWVAGVAHVQSVSEAPAGSMLGRCEMQLVIEAPNLPTRSVKIRDPRVPVNKWPLPGDMLPVMVAIDDQRHVRVIWDEVLTHAEADAAERGGRHADHFDDPEPDEDPIERRPWPDDDDFLPPAEDILADPDQTATVEERADGHRDDETVVVHQAGSGVVLEGTLVDPPTVVPLPRSPRPRPYPARGNQEPRRRDDEPENDPDSRTNLFQRLGMTLLVADLDRSLTFYRDQLGFDEVDRGETTVVLVSGGTRLVLRAVPDVAPVNRRLVHLNLEVNDIQATYEELKSAGVRFTYPPRAVNHGARLEQWAAAFRDPDGHGVALTQWRERATT